MAFDLYFAGARNKFADDHLLKLGANRLQSQLIDRKNIEIWCKEKSHKNKLFVDSGAYTAYTKGNIVDADDYISYLNSITHCLEIFAQLDKIPGRFNQPKSKQDMEEAPIKSWENYLYMRKRVLEPNKLLPIFHQGEDFKYLVNMLEWVDENGEHIPYIGVSPAFDLPGLENFLDVSFNIIKNSSNPNVKTHAFGMTRLDILEKYPYTSADSTSWKLSAAMGSIYTPYGTIYVSERGKYNKDYIFNQPKEAVECITEYINNQGFSVNDVANYDYFRYIININYLYSWAQNYEFKGKSVVRKSLF